MSAEAARFIGAAVAIFALYGIGTGMGNLCSTWISSVARNPDAEQKIRAAGIYGVALVESIALFALLIAMFILVK